MAAEPQSKARQGYDYTKFHIGVYLLAFGAFLTVASSDDAGLRYEVYESLLDLAGSIRSHFPDLQPRDNIDIQSVIWIVGNYRDEREIPHERLTIPELRAALRI